MDELLPQNFNIEWLAPDPTDKSESYIVVCGFTSKTPVRKAICINNHRESLGWYVILYDNDEAKKCTEEKVYSDDGKTWVTKKYEFRKTSR
jgi:hypothetical protein